MARKKEILHNIEVTSVSYKGHGVTLHPDGREIHILGAVPGDILDIQIYKRVKDIYYADVVEIKHESSYRISPREEEVYKSTSPWQIFDFNYENSIKKNFVTRFFKEHADTQIDSEIFFPNGFDIYNYRNKIEYGFWRDKESGKYSFSFFKRGSSRGKIPVTNSALNHPLINEVGSLFLDLVNSKSIDFGILKYLILRYSYKTNKVFAHLIIQKDFEELNISKDEFRVFFEKTKLLSGLTVSFSTPETPGARTEKEYLNLGKEYLEEKISDFDFIYHHSHFFQVYVPIFDYVIKDIMDVLDTIVKERKCLFSKMTDLFAGVGIFGITLNQFAESIVGVEISPNTKEFAETNAGFANLTNFDFIETDTDKATDILENSDIVIVDPPRAGISKDTIKAILKFKPEIIVYLSCNPQTQAMDFNWLKKDYKMIFNKGYNLFPRTPHVEHLIILEKI